MQWQHNTVPTPSTAAHGFTGVADNFCECLTRAVTIYAPGRVDRGATETLLIQPSTQYL